MSQNIPIIILKICYYYNIITMCFGRAYYVQILSLICGITSKLHIAAIFVLFITQTISCALLVRVFMVCLHIKFHTPTSDDSLVIAVELKTRENPRTDAMLLFFTLYRNFTPTKDSYLSLICFHTSFQNKKLSDASLARTSKHARRPCWRKLKSIDRGGFHWPNVH
jgi:hypothetical protein